MSRLFVRNGYLATARLGELRLENSLVLRFMKQGGDIPIFLGNEGVYLIFPVHDYPCGGGLHPTCGKPLGYLFPENGAYLVAHKPVQDPPCLLGVHQIQIYTALVFHGAAYGVLGNLVEFYAVFRPQIHSQMVRQMIAYYLPLPVRVGGEYDFVGLFRLGSYLLEYGGFALYCYVFRLEVVFLVHPKG